MSHIIPPVTSRVAARTAHLGLGKPSAGVKTPAAFSSAAEALRAKIRLCAARSFAARQQPPDETIFKEESAGNARAAGRKSPHRRTEWRSRTA